jgi:transcriptional regulator with XRE-family HTH domain
MKTTIKRRGNLDTAEGFTPAKRRAHLTPGRALKTIRELQEMTQVELATASGIDQSVISAMEHDRTKIGVERARKLARALCVHPAVLVFADWQADADSSSRKEPKHGHARRGHKAVA